MIEKADVVIVGGGVNGCALAYELSLKGIKAVVVERKHLASGATGRCGAGIRQQWSSRENAALAIESVRIFERLEEELGSSIGLRQGGYLIAIHDEKDMEQAEKNVEMQRSLGLDVSILEADEINDIVPILDIEGMKAIGATFCPTDGHADPFKTTYAYANAAMRNGAEIYRFTEVQDIVTDGEEIKAVRTNRGTIKTGVVVNAAGAWSKKIAEMAGIELP
ncbi:MAG: FAD-binding oxidoreductase, partial [Thermoplasmata archaeon]